MVLTRMRARRDAITTKTETDFEKLHTVEDNSSDVQSNDYILFSQFHRRQLCAYASLLLTISVVLGGFVALKLV